MENSSNLPETSAPSDGMMVGSGGAVGQLDPLAAPMMTTTPAVATASQEIAGSDNASIPTVLESMGGLEPTGLILTNYAANVVALCNKDIYVKRYNITSNTAAETIIDEIIFNPWDSNLVSAPIAIYGGAHTVFNGSIDIILNSYSAATIVGSIILAYVPPLLQKQFSPTLTNLTTVPHTILNLKVGGSSKITVTGGNLTDCAVSKAALEDGTSVYGKIYIAAFTDIVNAYGVAVSIPIVRFASLGKDSYFSHPAYLTGDSGGGILNPGPAPPVAENIILDSAVLYTPLGIDDSQSFYYPTNNSGSIKLIPYYDDTESAINEAIPNVVGGPVAIGKNPKFFWGSNPWGATFDGIGNNITKEGSNTTAVSIEDNGDQTYSADDVLDSPTSYFPFGSVAFTYNGLTMNVAGGKYNKFTKNFLTFGEQGAHMELPNVNAISVDFNIFNIEGKTGFVDGGGNTIGVYTLATSVLNATNFICDVPIESFIGASSSIRLYPESSTPTIELLGAPVLGNTPPSTPAPNGYVAVYFDDDAPFIPAVLPTANTTRSMPWPKAHNRFMAQLERWFSLNSKIGSYSYTATLSSGETLGDFLFNRKGVFMYDSVSSATNYSLFGNASTVIYQNYQSYVDDFPVIAEYNELQFTTRVTSPARSYTYAPPFRPLINKLVFNNMKQQHIEKALEDLYKRMDKWNKDEPQMFAAQLATSAVGGVAGVFGAKAQRDHETEMQKRELRFWAGGETLDYKKAMRLGDLRAQTELQKSNISKDVAMAQYGYNANAVMRGGGNSFNTGSNVGTTSTQTPSPQTASTASQAGRVNYGARGLSQSTTQSSMSTGIDDMEPVPSTPGPASPGPSNPGPSSPSTSSFTYRSRG